MRVWYCLVCIHSEIGHHILCFKVGSTYSADSLETCSCDLMRRCFYQAEALYAGPDLQKAHA